MTIERLVCPNCGEGDRFHQDVEIAASRGMKLVVGDDGKPKFEPDLSSELHFDGYRDVTYTSGIVECMCGATFKDVDELRVIWNDWQPGDVVIAPDGLRGTIDRLVRRGKDTLIMLVGWHEEFESWRLVPLTTTIRSEKLIPDA